MGLVLNRPVMMRSVSSSPNPTAIRLLLNRSSLPAQCGWEFLSTWASSPQQCSAWSPQRCSWVWSTASSLLQSPLQSPMSSSEHWYLHLKNQIRRNGKGLLDDTRFSPVCKLCSSALLLSENCSVLGSTWSPHIPEKPQLMWSKPPHSVGLMQRNFPLGVWCFHAHAAVKSASRRAMRSSQEPAPPQEPQGRGCSSPVLPDLPWMCQFSADE